APGKRYVLPNSKVMIHQGSGGFRGTPADIQIAAKEILSLTRRYAEIVALHANRDVEQVMRDIDRDRFLGPDEAVEYGLADHVLALLRRFEQPLAGLRAGFCVDETPSEVVRNPGEPRVVHRLSRLPTRSGPIRTGRTWSAV